MMKEFIIYPAFAVLFLGFAMQMMDIAQSASAKTVNYAQDMNLAMDCAFKGVDVKICSPNLLEHDFRPEINKTIETNKEMIKKLQEMQETEPEEEYAAKGYDTNKDSVSQIISEDKIENNMIVVKVR